MKKSRSIAGLVIVIAAVSLSSSRTKAGASQGSAPSPAGKIEKGDFVLTYDRSGLTGLAHAKDPYGAQFITAGQRLWPLIKYRVPEGDWLDAYRGETKLAASPERGTVTYADEVEGTVLDTVQTFQTDGKALDWTIELATRMNIGVEIGDLAAVIPWRFPAGENAGAIFEKSWTKHHFIAGHGSFLYFVRPNGEPPYLVATVHPGTKLEFYASEGRSAYRAFVHSGLTGGGEKRGTWRQPHSTLKLGPAGAPDSRARIGFRFRWADSYDEIRDILFEEGLFDVRVVPGMTVPEDLSVRLALRTKARVEELRPEFPGQTKITDLGEKKAGAHLYGIEFKRLGENLVTIAHDGGRETVLEFFVTEPLETLIKKRASFLAARQQHRDPNKWYDGLFSVYDMRAKVLRGPDDTDGFDFWWGYVLACDDPALSKAPFLASKNVRFPVPEEIAALEYYLERFVWGKLQRTDKESPYPYGIHGVPNWRDARDPLLRAKSRNKDLDKMKIWRSYDYPHVAMLYFHMFQIAERYPKMVRYLDAAGYLERAYQTARAYFTYPYEVLPWYETYKWGCYNELVILEIIDALEKARRPADAAWLRAEWEKKVKYFVYDDKYPFRSEYALDRTAFESSYALAKYGATHEMKPDANLWFDTRERKWLSHPSVKREDSRAFMDRQLRAGLAVRGGLEAAYYLLGADFTASSDTGAMSYMANMGGWGILDYGLNFAPVPYDWLQLGYASYLSSWSLVNSGRPETNYGFWFPGKENDGAAGWQFMTAKWGRAWIRKEVPRGAWPYDGEIDLGFGAGLRMAATILTRDPLFDWVAYGGSLSVGPKDLSVTPRDGLRQRFFAVFDDGSGLKKLKIELDRDGFASGQPILVDTSLGRVSFLLENRTGDAHDTVLRLSFPPGQDYSVFQAGKKIVLERTGIWDYPFSASLRPAGPSTRIELARE
jgi:hypothetical protein